MSDLHPQLQDVLRRADELAQLSDPSNPGSSLTFEEALELADQTLVATDGAGREWKLAFEPDGPDGPHWQWVARETPAHSWSPADPSRFVPTVVAAPDHDGVVDPPWALHHPSLGPAAGHSALPDSPYEPRELTCADDDTFDAEPDLFDIEVPAPDTADRSAVRPGAVTSVRQLADAVLGAVRAAVWDDAQRRRLVLLTVAVVCVVVVGLRLTSNSEPVETPAVETPALETSAEVEGSVAVPGDDDVSRVVAALTSGDAATAGQVVARRSSNGSRAVHAATWYGFAADGMSVRASAPVTDQEAEPHQMWELVDNDMVVAEVTVSWAHIGGTWMLVDWPEVAPTL